MPTYYIDIQVIIIQVSVQRDIAVTELNNHACRTSESSPMIGYFLAYYFFTQISTCDWQLLTHRLITFSQTKCTAVNSVNHLHHQQFRVGMDSGLLATTSAIMLAS